MERTVGRGIPRRDRRALAALLREARLAAGLRQEDLAARMGVAQSFVARYEAVDRQLSFLEVRAVCAALGLPFAAFVERVEAALANPTEEARA